MHLRVIFVLYSLLFALLVLLSCYSCYCFVSCVYCVKSTLLLLVCFTRISFIIYHLSLFLLIPHSYLFVVVINIGLIVILFMGMYFICHCQDNLLFVIFHNDCKNNMVCKSVIFFSLLVVSVSGLHNTDLFCIVVFVVAVDKPLSLHVM